MSEFWILRPEVWVLRWDKENRELESVPVASPLGEKAIFCPKDIPVLGLTQKSIVIASDQGERGDLDFIMYNIIRDCHVVRRRPSASLGFAERRAPRGERYSSQ